MKVSLTEMATDSKKVLDQVVQKNKRAEVQRHGKTVATIKPSVGVSREELIRRLNHVSFTKAERAELTKAMDESAKVFGYGGRD